MAVDQVYTASLAKPLSRSTVILLDSDISLGKLVLLLLLTTIFPFTLSHASPIHFNFQWLTDTLVLTMADLHTVIAPREDEDTETTLRKSSTSRSKKGEATQTADALLGAQSSAGATETDFTEIDAAMDGDVKQPDGSGSQ